MDDIMSVAVAAETDVLFLLESFWGHGYRRDDTTGRCYRGPNSELWFDATCIHPNPAGHAVMADRILQALSEQGILGEALGISPGATANEP